MYTIVCNTIANQQFATSCNYQTNLFSSTCTDTHHSLKTSFRPHAESKGQDVCIFVKRMLHHGILLITETTQ